MTISRVVAIRWASIGLHSRRWRVIGLSLTRAGWNAGGRSSASMCAGPNNELGKVSNVSSFSAKAIGYSPARVHAGDAAPLHCDLRRDSSEIAMTARMRAAVENTRRWGAAGIFRPASLILRCAMNLHQQRRISYSGLRTVLSGTRWLERFGGWLALGNRRKHRPTKQDLRKRARL
jgi:hypothetical protein